MQELLILLQNLSSSPVFSEVSFARSFVFCVVFCRSLFVLLSSIFWPLCCLTFSDLRLFITPLVSSNFSLTHYGHYFSSYLFLIVDVYRR